MPACLQDFHPPKELNPLILLQNTHWSIHGDINRDRCVSQKLKSHKLSTQPQLSLSPVLNRDLHILCMSEHMHTGWRVGGWTDGRTDGWTGGQVGGWTGGLTQECTGGQADDGRTYGRMDARTHARTHAR